MWWRSRWLGYSSLSDIISLVHRLYSLIADECMECESQLFSESKELHLENINGVSCTKTDVCKADAMLAAVDSGIVIFSFHMYLLASVTYWFVLLYVNVMNIQEISQMVTTYCCIVVFRPHWSETDGSRIFKSCSTTS